MRKKLSRLIEPNIQPCFLCLILFIIAAVPVQPWLAVVEAAVMTAFFIAYRKQRSRRRRSAMQYLENLTGGDIRKNSLLNTPLPVVVFRDDSGEIIWANDAFAALPDTQDDIFEMNIRDLSPNFSWQWAAEGIQPEDCTEMDGCFYQVYGGASRLADGSQVITAYFIDVTGSRKLQEVYASTRPVVAVFVVDNYDELMKSISDAARSAMQAQIDGKLCDYVAGSGGMLRKYNRDRYIFVCDEGFYDKMVAEKFSVLEDMHQVIGGEGFSATLSIGIGKECGNYDEAIRWAEKSIEMALSRGGDQAVVKDSLDYQFYGGKSKSTEKRTKVKSRVMAKALGELLADAGQIYVMGHEYADMDAVGAAAGICCAARKRGKKAQIVIDMEGNNARPLVRKLAGLPEYEDVFVSGQEAFIHAQPGALLVVVDTNRPELVESRQLLDACNRVAVIDHHRRAATYIENAALNFHEPYASSASELVTELLQYLVEPSDLLDEEAEALMAGIMLDTKNFILHTGGRTFEAAAFLRRAGAETSEVRRYFQSDLPSMIQRYDIIRTAKVVHGDIAVAVAENDVSRITAAKAADDLLTLQGIQASIVLYRQGDGVSMSARSLGEINVQVIVEPLGGGGNATAAGGYIPNCGSMESVRLRLMASIEKYYES